MESRKGYVEVMRGAEAIWDFIREQSDDDAVFDHLKIFVRDALASLEENKQHDWPGDFVLCRVRECTLLDGRVVDSYCFEYRLVPPLSSGLSADERAEAMVTFCCFLRLDEARRIVEYIEAIRTS